MQTGLIVGNFEDTVVKWLVDPFHFYGSKIKRRLQLKLAYEKTSSLQDISSALGKHQPDILFFTIDWASSVNEAVDYLKDLYEKPNRPRLVFLDYFDQSTTPFLPAMQYVDLYLRKQLLKDIEQYKKMTFRGKNNISDYVSKEYDLDPGDWEFGSCIPEGTEDKLMLGWNLGTAGTLSRPYRYPLLRKFKKPAAKRLDLTCRIALLDGEGSENTYYHIHRSKSLEAVAALEGKFNVAHNANGERIPFKQFQRELCESHMALSPFGWGEITDRDFRIINANTLLVKPDMSHLITAPDVFRAGETYVPIKWDFSNLEGVCEYYLTHPKEAQEIRENAIRVYDEYYRNDKFVDKIEEILRRLEG